MVADDGVKQRCFARPVRSDEADDFSGGDVEADFAICNNASEGLENAAHFENRIHWS